MSTKKAYVIMPYDNRYKRFYSMVIKRAVEEMGYQCVREDLTGLNGHVLSNVIRNLAEADIVIADLTSLNWNVAYELGMRHALRTKGTIMLCEESTKNEGLPFDIQHYGIVLYPANWLEEEKDDSIVAKIIQQIEANEREDVIDSPVHEVYRDLPKNLIDAINPDNDELEARIQELEEQNRTLRERVEKAGLHEHSAEGPSSNIHALLQEAVANSIYYSDDAVRHLRSLQDAGKKEEFAEFLALVLDKGFLDEQDCRIVYSICRRLGVPMLTRVFLEQAVLLYPDSEELNTFLADELSKSYKTRDKALTIVNERIGLTRKNGKYELSQKHPSSASLAAFFNVYIELKYFNEILQIAPLLLEKNPKLEMQCLIRRNVIVSLNETGRNEEALAAAQELLALDSTSDSNHLRAYQAYRENGMYTDAYQELEWCIYLDPEDENHYYRMAGFICDELVARTSVSEEPAAIHRSEKERYAAPFVLYWLSQTSPSSGLKRAVDFLTRNNFGGVCERMIRALKAGLSGEALLEQFDDFDFSFVQHCINWGE